MVMQSHASFTIPTISKAHASFTIATVSKAHKSFTIPTVSKAHKSFTIHTVSKLYHDHPLEPFKKWSSISDKALSAQILGCLVCPCGGHLTCNRIAAGWCCKEISPLPLQQ